MLVLITVIVYFAVLLLLSHLVDKRGGNAAFFTGNRQSPWPLVAFGMIGASISGLTFIGVPGWVTSIDMTYLQMCLGFIVGYLIVAFVLLPLYYKLRLTSIYTYLAHRFGSVSYKTGASFFILSKLLGAAAKFYVVCRILQMCLGDSFEVPYIVVVLVALLLIWLYTRRSGIRALVWTDFLQTLCLLLAMILILVKVTDMLHMNFSEAMATVWNDSHAKIFEFSDFASKQNFWKQFLSGIFIVIVMTGLDQDMMQKNLTCKNPLPEKGDDLLSGIVLNGTMGTACLIFFTIGVIASAFSSADSAMTAMTTSFCVDILGKEQDEKMRKRVHFGMFLAFFLVTLAFNAIGSGSVMDLIYTLVSYTYGPLLGLFAFGMFTKCQPREKYVPYIAIASPLICYVIDAAVLQFTGYKFGYEMLMFNGLLTFMGLWAVSHRKITI